MHTAFSIILLVVVVGTVIAIKSGNRASRNEGAEKMVCPHCGERGTVHVRPVKVKRGISGGKAVGAVFTGGLSMLATGLSRKERHLSASCSNCRATWLI